MICYFRHLLENLKHEVDTHSQGLKDIFELGLNRLKELADKLHGADFLLHPLQAFHHEVDGAVGMFP